MTAGDPRPTLAASELAEGATGNQWLAASYRCSCGFATNAAGEFDRHLVAAEGAQPEHFEVLAGWTFQQVRQWLAASVTGSLLAAGSDLPVGKGRPLAVWLEVPLSAREMVAALYGEHERLMQADLATDQDVWLYVAVVVAQDGMRAIGQLADAIDEQERYRSLTAPEWLAWCRRRVNEVAAQDVPTSVSRVR
jgi:hypothetical protein